MEFNGPRALGAGAFAGFPALEELDLARMPLGEAGAALLGRRRWARLKKLTLSPAGIDAAALAALALGAWPALEVLDVYQAGLPPTDVVVSVGEVRRWAPALVELFL